MAGHQGAGPELSCHGHPRQGGDAQARHDEVLVVSTPWNSVQSPGWAPASSAALFGKFQQVTAIQLGLNPVLTTSASLFGGVMGKLISPQSIAVACAAVGLVGKETDLFRKTLKYSMILLGIVIIVVLLPAFVIPWLLPTAPAVSYPPHGGISRADPFPPLIP